MLVQHDLPADLVVQGDADSREEERIDFAEIDRLFGDRARLIMHPELGRTLEARRTIPACRRPLPSAVPVSRVHGPAHPNGGQIRGPRLCDP